MNEDRMCGTCKYNRYHRYDDGIHRRGTYSCGNGNSDYCGSYTEYSDECAEWEKKE